MQDLLSTKARHLDPLSTKEGDFQRFEKDFLIYARERFGEIGNALFTGQHVVYLLPPPETRWNQATNSEVNKKNAMELVAKEQAYNNNRIKITATIQAHLDARIQTLMEGNIAYYNYVRDGDFVALWQLLKQRFAVPEAELIPLRITAELELFKIKQGQSEDLENYNIRFLDASQRLKTLGAQVEDLKLAWAYLRGLEQTDIASTIMMDPTKVTTLETVMSMVNRMYNTRNMMRSEIKDVPEIANLANKKHCFICEKRGKRHDSHSTQDCFTLARLENENVNTRKQKKNSNNHYDQDRKGKSRKHEGGHKDQRAAFSQSDIECIDNGNQNTSEYPVVLDTGCTTHLWTERQKSIHRTTKAPKQRIIGISGSIYTSSKGYHPLFGEVTIYGGKLNLVSYSKVRKMYIPRFDNIKNKFILTNRMLTIEFGEKDGIYVMDKIQEHGTKPNEVVLFTKEETERAREAQLLHEKLDHPSYKRMIETLKAGALIGTSITARDVKLVGKILGDCPACKKGKSVRDAAKSSDSELDNQCDQSVHMDIFYIPSSATSKNQEVDPYLIVIDGYSGMVMTTKLRSKHQHDVTNTLSKVISEFSEFEHKIREFRCDNEPSLLSCRQYLQDRGITLSTTGPGRHECRSERYIRSIKDKIRSVIFGLSFNLPRRLLPFLVEHVTTSMNCIVGAQSGQRTPREIFTGTKPDARKWLTSKFGEIVLCKVPNGNNGIQDPRVEEAMVIGRVSRSPKTLNVILLGSGEIVKRQSVSKTAISLGILKQIKRLGMGVRREDFLWRMISVQGVLFKNLMNMKIYPNIKTMKKRL
jgi:hypothetical protein